MADQEDGGTPAAGGTKTPQQQEREQAQQEAQEAFEELRDKLRLFAIENADGTWTFPLQSPVPWGGTPIETLAVRRLNGKGLRILGSDPGPADYLRAAPDFVRMDGPAGGKVNEKFIDELDGVDAQRVIAILTYFFYVGQMVGVRV